MSVIIRRQNGEEFEITAPTRSPEPIVQATDNPIEDGSRVSDHAEVMPIRLTVEGRISETPLGEPQPNRIEEALRFFNKIGRGFEPVEVEARYQSYPDMLLLEWPHDETKLRGLAITLTFREVRFADVETVALPREVPRVEAQDTAPDDVDTGTQPTQDVNESEEEETQTSWAASGIDWLF